MDRQVLLATYDDMATARQVVAELVAMNVSRSDIGLAAFRGDGAADRALVTATVSAGQQELAARVLKAHAPQALDVRRAEWRQQLRSGLNPDEAAYIAVPLAGRSRPGRAVGA
jgi:hypothetical protein